MDQGFLPKEWHKLHHAYIISGTDVDSIWDELYNTLSFEKKANPDVYSAEHETFGIDEARTLSNWAILKPIGGERKVAVISATSFTIEAQNALLKLFEEPGEGTYFFIIIPSIGSILPTLLSRVRTISLKEDSKVNKKFDLFLESPVAERLNIVNSIIKSKDKEKARDFIKFLEQKMKDVILSKDKKYDSTKKILEVGKYIGSRGSSVKMILEYLAISL